MTIQGLLIRLPIPDPTKAPINDEDYMEILNLMLSKHKQLTKDNIISIHSFTIGYYIIFYESANLLIDSINNYESLESERERTAARTKQEPNNDGIKEDHINPV